MTVDLSRRETDALELMDDPDCDPTALGRTYDAFDLVNRVVAGWRRVYRDELRPRMRRGTAATLLDIGSGGGDVPRALARWAARDGHRLDITAIDPDARAHSYASGRAAVTGLVFRRASSSDLVVEGARFDFVTSNHVLHHLDPESLAGLLSDSERLATRFVVHNDIERARLAYSTYRLGTRFGFAGSFIHHDGLLSVRRSYRLGEIARMLPPGWRVRRQFPYRVLVSRAGAGGPAHA